MLAHRSKMDDGSPGFTAPFTAPGWEGAPAPTGASGRVSPLAVEVYSMVLDLHWSPSHEMASSARVTLARLMPLAALSSGAKIATRNSSKAQRSAAAAAASRAPERRSR